MNAWSHLPNAAHIDSIIEDAKARPRIWATASGDKRGVVWVIAWDTAWIVARSLARVTAWDAVQRVALTATRGIARDAAWGAMNALIAWDESAALLDLTPDALRTIIDVADGDVKHQAVLLLPAVIARSTP